jgi:hypothetical protein
VDESAIGCSPTNKRFYKSAKGKKKLAQVPCP